MEEGLKSSDCRGREGFGRFIFAESWVEVVLTLLGLFYVTYRLVNLPLAPDEWGYLYSIHHHSLADHFTTADWHDENATYEMLPLLASHVCYHLFRFNEIQRIRIPSLLFFGVYLGAIWLIRQQFTRRFIGRLAFVALLGNAFVLDYFSVARSYSLTMTFAAWSLVALFELERGKRVWAHVAVWSAALAVASNFSLLYFYIAVLFAALFLLRRESFSHLFSLASSALVLGAFYLPKFIIMMQHNASIFSFGGTSGFVSDTVVSLVRCILYVGGPDYPMPTSWLEAALGWLAIVLVLCGSIISLRNKERRGSLISFCMLAIAAMSYAGHVILHVRFPVERSALYLIPLFVLQIACLADCTSRRWFRSGLASLLVMYSVTAVWGVNLSHTCLSRVMADIPALVQDLARIHQRNGKPIELCLSNGTKWIVWYYAELATKLPENERLLERECFAEVDWLDIYEPHCGVSTEAGRLFAGATTHLFLSSDDYPPTWFPHDTALVREYPVSHWRLYSQVEEVSAHYEQALLIRPDFADGHYNLGNVFLREGRVSDAIGHYESALRIKPDSAEAHEHLGVALERMSKVSEAVWHYEQALHLKSDYAEAQNNLAWLLATHAPAEGADPIRAVALAERACKLTDSRVATYLDTLAAAYAAAGRFDAAVAMSQKAIDLARSAGQAQLVKEIEARLELYRSGRAYSASTGVTSPSNP